MKKDSENKLSECLNETYMVFRFILQNIEAENKEDPMSVGTFQNFNSPEVCALLYIYSMETPLITML